MTISANGAQPASGILWETTGDYAAGTPGTLHAYDAFQPGRRIVEQRHECGARPDDADHQVRLAYGGECQGLRGRQYERGHGLRFIAPGGNPAASPSIATMTNAASYSSAVSPGELVAIFGTNLGPLTPVGLQLDASGSVATSIAGTQVLFGGVASPLIFSSARQVNAVVPFSATGTTQVQVQYLGRSSTPFPVSVAPAAIGIFSADSTGTGQGNGGESGWKPQLAA